MTAKSVKKTEDESEEAVQTLADTVSDHRVR